MIVIVAGMHRSGTSAVAGLLHNNGITMGEDRNFYPPPMKENPKGFFENRRFRYINDRILRLHGYSVKSFSTDIPCIGMGGANRLSVLPDLSDAMKDCIRHYNRNYVLWGWKDPRTCLTMSYWVRALQSCDLLQDTKIVIPYRTPEDVSASMIRRGNKQKEGPDQFVKLARLYNERLLEIITMCGIDNCFVHFNSLITQPSCVAKDLSEYLNCDIPDISFIDAHVSRTRRENL